MRRRELPGGMPPPSKTELKRRARSVQVLADRLVDAPAEVVASVELPEKLADAVAAARRTTGRGARARQRQYVAKLMRGVDLAPIEAALEARAGQVRRDAARLRRAERWRDRLIAEGEPAIAAFAAEHSAAHYATLARLVADATARRAGSHDSRAARELFRLIRDWMNAS
jgi:ribosome-associated protein